MYIERSTSSFRELLNYYLETLPIHDVDELPDCDFRAPDFGLVSNLGSVPHLHSVNYSMISVITKRDVDKELPK